MKLIRHTASLVMLLAIAAGSPGLQAEEGWPRSIEEEGYVMTLYQPQVDELSGDTVEGRAVISLKEADGSGEPVFGAVWFSARLETDRDERVVRLRGIAIPDVRFPEATDEQRGRLARLIESTVPQWDLSYDLDLLVADLDEVRSPTETPGLRHEPPAIVHSEKPAILLRYDGEPVVRQLPQDSRVEWVINTPLPVFRETGGGDFYLSGGGDLWYSAPDALGPWTVTSDVPEKIAALSVDEEEDGDDTASAGEEPPDIVVATESTELIVTAGEPHWSPVEGTVDLLYCDNTDADVFLELGSQSYYVLLSGRWYRGVAVDDGLEWEHVPNDELPEPFSDIPEESVNGHVLASVAGTRAAREAALDNAIPQTAAIRRDDSSLVVKYDGEPQFDPVEEVVELSYAVNTASSVFRYGSSYYACDEGVWYVSNAPTGPWSVATRVPSAVYDIPPSNPHHNVTYVQVYDVTPEVVYVGYTPGYVGSYSYSGCVVWGTGWRYRPWWGPYYYPRPWTWGLSVRYNPYFGWSFGLTWSNGPFRITIGRGGGFYGGWWGVGRYRPVYRPYPRPGYRKPVPRPLPARGAGATRPGALPAQRPTARPGGSNIYDRPATRDRQASRGPSTADRKRPAPAAQPNDVLTDRSGNVYRRDQGGNWEQHRGGKWQPAEGLDRSRPAAPPSARPSAPPKPATRPSIPSQPSAQPNVPSRPSAQPYAPGSRGGSYGAGRSPRGASRPQLERDSRARQRGSQRSSQFRAQPGARGGRRR